LSAGAAIESILARAYDPLVRLVAVATLALGFAASTAAGSVVIQFRTPSGNIGCAYATGFGGGPSLRCDILSGLKPRPARPPRCDLDWGDSYELRTTGRPSIVCHGDTAIDPHSRVLRYGTTWSRSGFTCSSKSAGLRCRNRSGHGFFLSRAHSYRF
jgi:uncharacterized protein DUF6636